MRYAQLFEQRCSAPATASNIVQVIPVRFLSATGAIFLRLSATIVVAGLPRQKDDGKSEKASIQCWLWSLNGLVLLTQ